MIPILATLAALAIVLVAVLAVGARLSLDTTRAHSRETNALSSVGKPGSPCRDGLVTIDTAVGVFRARVRNLDGSGDPLIMLHGWPQSSMSWEPLSVRAADHGFRAVAFDQRGYSPGARTANVLDYSIDRLVADVLAVADRLGFDRFHLAGHDWGAAVGWGVVMTRPERVLSWSALSIPHSLAFVDALKNDPAQKRKSAYMLLLRTPWLAESVLSWGRFLVLRRLMYRWMPPEHEREYLRLLAEPGALTATLSWYRAMGRGPSLEAEPRVSLPVLFAWGSRDPAVSRGAVERQEEYLSGEYEYVELDAGHWLLERRTEVVTSAILRHIIGHAASRAGPQPKLS